MDTAKVAEELDLTLGELEYQLPAASEGAQRGTCVNRWISCR